VVKNGSNTWASFSAGDTTAAVAHGHGYEFRAVARLDSFNRDEQLTLSFHRVAGVGCEIHQRRLELAHVGLDWRRLLMQCQLYFDAGAQNRPQHLDYLL
jgi:hypothetical protein